MKIKYLAPILLILFIFSFTGCKTTTAAETTAAAETNTTVTTIPETATSKVTAKDKIAFASDRDDEYEAQLFEIYIMNSDGTEQVRLTNNPHNDVPPSFSPDGSKIAFMSNRDGNAEIYIMNIDGSELINLTNNPSNDAFPSFSPDGSKIAFHSNRDGNSEIYTMNIDGTEQIRLTNNPAYEGEPFFSPDGSKIAFVSDRDGNDQKAEIYIMNADGSEQVNLTNNPANDGEAFFSPDGSKIAFHSNRDGNDEIYIMNVDGTEQTRLTNNPSRDKLPSFSPDGSKIAFMSDRDGNAEIYIMNIDGSELINLTNNPANDWYPCFSPITEAITAETTASEAITAETTALAASDYSIGDTGPAGGLIFYINPNYTTDGWKYLEAAASDLPGDYNNYFITWNNGDHILIGATEIAIGSGMSNTQEIVNIQGEGSYAAKLCSDLTKGGYSDWFLPSIDELNLMYENLYLNGLGSFEPDVYWSSSEINTKTASSLYFNDGGQYFDYKHLDDDNKHIYGLRVRAARAF